MDAGTQDRYHILNFPSSPTSYHPSMPHQLSAQNQAAAVNLVKGGKALKFLHVISLTQGSESHVAWMLKNKHF